MPQYRNASYGGQSITLTTSGNYGGAAIMPDVIAVNLMGILDRAR